MKKPIAFLYVVAAACSIVLGCSVFAFSMSTLVDDGALSEQFEHTLEFGPYPKDLPAGHSLVFNGSQYSTFGPGQTAPWSHGEADPCEAVHWAWAMREYRLKRAHEKQAHVYHESPPVHWTIVTKPDTGNWCDATAK